MGTVQRKASVLSELSRRNRVMMICTMEMRLRCVATMALLGPVVPEE